MPVSLQAILASIVAFLPSLLAGIAILVVGWLVAIVVSRLVGGLLHRTNLDNRLAGMLKGGQPERVPIERWISTAVFWLIMIFVIVLFLQTINVGQVAAPLNALLTQITTFIPNFLAALALALVAWVVATILRMLIVRVFGASGLSKSLSDQADMDARNRVSIGQTIGNVVYWLVFLLFLPAILDTLQLRGILTPVQNMVNGILSALPNILGAAVVLAVGFLVARVLRQIVTNLLAGLGIDRLGHDTGVTQAEGQTQLSNIIGTVVYVLVMIPVIIAALNVLDIPAISTPAANMLNMLLNAIPLIFGAALILVIAYFVARLVGSLVTNILTGIGFNNIFRGILPSSMTGSSPGTPAYPQTMRQEPIPVTGIAATGAQEFSPEQLRRASPAQIMGTIATVAILLFAIMEAARLLGFAALGVLLGDLIVTISNILFGLLIFGIGLYLANLAYRAVQSSNVSQANILATAARVSIIIFSGALALRQMGIGQDIVNLAFGLLLGAVAVATALAFGLGGRDVAHQVLERWRERMRLEENRPSFSSNPANPSGLRGRGSEEVSGTASPD